jgi:D-amino-acid dehydrogenase
MSELRVAVVGAGIIGLAIAYQLIKVGVHVTVLERAPHEDGASVVNAGGIAVTEVVPASSAGVGWRIFGWMIDPLGPLAVRPRHAIHLIPWLLRFRRAGSSVEVSRIAQALSALNARVYEDLLPMLDDLRLRQELHAAGALCVYASESGFKRDAAEWELKRAYGIEMQQLSGADARKLEPALSPRVQRAVFTPQWSHIDDPRRVVLGLKRWLQGHGAKILTAEVRRVRPGGASGPSLEVADGSDLGTLDRVVVAAGAWSGELVRQIGDRVVLESERGYNVTLPDPKINVTREIIFAEHKFVATPMSCGLRIGGAAEFGGLTARPNFKRSAALLELARRYLPELDASGGVSMQGHRPATPDSLPVISASQKDRKIFYAFGHGHLGLTHAATTGRLVSDLILGKTPPIDLTPYSIGRFRGRAQAMRL